MQRRTVLVAGVAGLTATFLPRGAGAHGDAAGAQVILDALRDARHRAALPGLTPMPTLNEMARRQTVRMWNLGTMTHAGTGGADPNARAEQAGYRGRLLGETLAESHDSAAETVATWLAHTATRPVLLEPEARDVGIFGLREDTGRVWWGLVVGQPSGA